MSATTQTTKAPIAPKSPSSALGMTGSSSDPDGFRKAYSGRPPSVPTDYTDGLRSALHAVNGCRDLAEAKALLRKLVEDAHRA